MISSAYVHIPFCSSICAYCAFQRSANLRLMDAWLKTICQEIEQTLEQYRRQHPDFSLHTLYFGGGTPSVLSPEQFEQLARIFQPYVSPDVEWTMEMNPDSVSIPLLETMKKCGVNRISLGIQSLNAANLKRLSRRHSSEEALQALDLIQKEGFENISADFMFGFPWQKAEDLAVDLQKIIDLHLPHLSIYSLILEEDSVFGKQNLQPADEDFQADAYEMVCDVLKQNGYVHYEISSFCQPGFTSRHNRAYWQDENYFGFGYGACGRDEQGLYHHQGSLQSYIEQGYQKVYDDHQDRAFEAIMTGLRTREGLDIERWQSCYHQDFFHTYQDVLETYKDVLCFENNRLFCSEKGMEILDSILVAFL